MKDITLTGITNTFDDKEWTWSVPSGYPTYPSNGSGTTTITTTGTGLWSQIVDNSPVLPSKEDYIKQFLLFSQAEERVVMILEKVRSKKLSVVEALQILKGDKALDING